MKKKLGLWKLPDFEEDVYCWIEQESSIMLKAVDFHYGDPVELTSNKARELGLKLVFFADELEKCNK